MTQRLEPICEKGEKRGAEDRMGTTGPEHTDLEACLGYEQSSEISQKDDFLGKLYMYT